MSQSLSVAITAFQQGRLPDAVEACEQVLQADPFNAEALNLLGIVRSSAGQDELGAKLMRRSVELAPRIVEYRKNYSKVLMRLGKLEEAEASVREALRQNPKVPDLLGLLGVIVGQQGKRGEGIELLKRAIAAAPNVAVYHFNLAELHRQNQDRKSAMRSLERALRIAPDQSDALNNLAGLQIADGQFIEAMQSIQRLLMVNPRSVQGFCNLGTLLGAAGDTRSAAQALRNALILDPTSTRAKFQLANMLIQDGELEEAEQLIADLRSSSGADWVSFKTTHARILERRGNIAGALEIIDSIENDHQNDVDVAVLRGILLEQLGRREDAVRILEGVLADNQVAAVDGIGIHFTLGQLHDSLGDFDKAFESYRIGNENRKRAFIRVDSQVVKASSASDEIIALHREELYRTIPTSSLDTEVPIFIIGMPRSGSSLVEQILASHSMVHGAGELTAFSDIVRETYGKSHNANSPLQIIASDPSGGRFGMVPKDWESITVERLDEIGRKYLAFIRTLNADAPRITDKMPYNYFLAPVIAKVFPHAKIIHSLRHPLDTCLSCYFVNFTLGSQFAFDLEDLGDFYREYSAMMDVWQDVLRIPMLEIQYEQLVNDPEPNVRRMLEFCDLPWESQCLDFHRSKRVISTASYQQVRQPIYTRSAGRWTNYAKHLGPLIRALEKNGSLVLDGTTLSTVYH